MVDRLEVEYKVELVLCITIDDELGVVDEVMLELEPPVVM